MNDRELKKLLASIKSGDMTLEDAMQKIKQLTFVDLEFAKIDTHREIRTGFPEVIFCSGKTIPQIKAIAAKMTERKINILASRAGEDVYEALKPDFKNCEYYPEARTLFIKNTELHAGKSVILVASGGTADIPVAEEAAVTAEKLGNTVERLYDVGVAGMHRLLNHSDKLEKASVIIAVAGMEGALASVIGGLTDKPVIAVPTSIGYGASFGGLAALLSMLNSCAGGVGVVNIDNGFGAAFLAAKIVRQIEKVGK